MKGPYIDLKEYYNSAEWAKKRSERLKIDDYRCQRCGFTRALEVHHLNYERLGNEDVARDLITLCKKCHSEVEAQKESVNPVRQPAEHHDAYLAGKISQNDWRFYSPGFVYPEDIKKGIDFDVNDNLTITGPFFIACDHGCYHGPNKHGVGAVNSLPSIFNMGIEKSDEEYAGCMGTFFSREDVLNICKMQIDKADILFAYIDKSDCYGTLAEIGYAHALGKDIVIVFANENLKQEMWFVDKMQQRSDEISDKWIEEQLINKLRRTNK